MISILRDPRILNRYFHITIVLNIQVYVIQIFIQSIDLHASTELDVLSNLANHIQGHAGSVIDIRSEQTRLHVPEPGEIFIVSP